jgi:iron only hydrogenase large subunit-like protein
MPCVRKKGESMRSEYVFNGVRDVDEVITTRDLAALLRAKRIDPASLDPAASFDAPFGRGSGAGQLFGVTGGVMEAAVRTVYAIVTGGETMPRLELEPVRGLEGLKEARVRLPLGDGGGGGRDLRVAVVHGLADAKTLIADMRDGTRAYDFVEVMACPGGCIGGGGQPKPPRGADPKAVLRERADAVYALDAGAPVRVSRENPAVRRAYARWLGPEVGSARALETLHVERPRGGDAEAPPPFPPSPCGVECDACGLRFARSDDDEGGAATRSIDDEGARYEI